MIADRVYIVTKDVDGMGRQKNICVTTEPDTAKMVCDEAYEPGDGPRGSTRKETFIEVWVPGHDSPETVTREHPDDIDSGGTHE